MNLYFQQVSLDADTDTTDPLRQVPQCFHFNVILCVCVSVCVCVCVCLLLTQSCPTLCNPMDSILPISSVHGIS